MVSGSIPLAINTVKERRCRSWAKRALILPCFGRREAAEAPKAEAVGVERRDGDGHPRSGAKRRVNPRRQGDTPPLSEKAGLGRYRRKLVDKSLTKGGSPEVRRRKAVLESG